MGMVDELVVGYGDRPGRLGCGACLCPVDPAPIEPSGKGQTRQGNRQGIQLAKQVREERLCVTVLVLRGRSRL